MIAILDNYDSFVHNIEQYVGEYSKVEVCRYDSPPDADGIIFSPGPGKPEEFPVMEEILNNKSCPILGICLGHQAISKFFGGEIGYADNVVHGKSSNIYHSETEIFEGLPNPMEVGRYHSIIVNEVLEDLEITARAGEKIMAIKHRYKPIYGVQFHPESILTPKGKGLIKNFIDIVKDYN